MRLIVKSSALLANAMIAKLIGAMHIERQWTPECGGPALNYSVRNQLAAEDLHDQFILLVISAWPTLHLLHLC